MHGQQVAVRLPVRGEPDALGIASTSWSDQVVDDVLVAPGAGDDVKDPARPDGDAVAYTAYFPKAFAGSLRGGQVRIEGRWLDVVGDPRPYPSEVTPGRWNRVVKLAEVRG